MEPPSRVELAGPEYETGPLPKRGGKCYGQVMTDEIVGVGSPVQLSPSGQARTCKKCGGSAYVTASTIAHMRTVAAGKPLRFICLLCVQGEPDTDFKLMPFNSEQIAEIHAAGIDMSADQINAESKRLLEMLIKRSPKR